MYKIYLRDKSIKAELPTLEDAVRFIKDNSDGKVYVLEFEGTELNVRVPRDIKKKLALIPGGRL